MFDKGKGIKNKQRIKNPKMYEAIKKKYDDISILSKR